MRGERLTDDERLVVRGDDAAVGKHQGSRAGGDGPVRAHDGQLRGLERLAAEQIAAEVADVCGAVGGDDHVVGVACRDG